MEPRLQTFPMAFGNGVIDADRPTVTMRFARIGGVVAEDDVLRGVGASVGKVTQEDEPPALGVGAVLSIAKVGKQIVKGVDLGVRVAHNVEWLGEEGTDKGIGHGHLFLSARRPQMPFKPRSHVLPHEPGPAFPKG